MEHCAKQDRVVRMGLGGIGQRFGKGDRPLATPTVNGDVASRHWSLEAYTVRVLVVEDDPAIAGPLVRGLQRVGFEADHVATGQAALAAEPGDVVLLDLGLPDLDGLDVCRRLRQRSNVPIIIVTARGDEVDRVVGLEVGADDYIVKPFGMREVVARIRAVLRRAGSEPHASSVADDPTERTVAGGLTVDRRTHRVLVDDTEISLTPTEFDVLELLARDPGAVVRRSEILDEVWGGDWYGPTKTIDVHVAAVRRKLGDPGWIETVRGVGFRLVDVADRP